MNDVDTAIDSAKAAGLRYVSDDIPGISREKRGTGFTYRDPAGKRVTDKATLERIASLAIPPAYRDVWICPYQNGHIQATARDARGRKQYRYHPKWRAVRDETKYARALAFARQLPRIRERVAADLALPAGTREQVLAAVAALLERTTIRIGNDEYAKENGSYGLTTLRNEHAAVRGETVRFAFRGKSGVRHAVSLSDKRLAKIVRACQEIPGQRLFEYRDGDGDPHPVSSNDVNDYIRSIAGDDFTAKDFRTWEGTVACAMLLADRSGCESERERKQHVTDVVKQVAERLGNTPAVCRSCYVHPDVIAEYVENGTLGNLRKSSSRGGLSPEERFVVRVLERRQTQTERAA